MSPCLVNGAAWIFRISSLACSFGSGISTLRSSRPWRKLRKRIFLQRWYTTWPHQCWIKNIRSICRHNNFHFSELIKSINLIKELLIIISYGNPIKNRYNQRCHTSISVRWTSLSALVPSPIRRAPIASISSMKMMQGSWSRAYPTTTDQEWNAKVALNEPNISRIIRELSPIYLSTTALATTFRSK